MNALFMTEDEWWEHEYGCPDRNATPADAIREYVHVVGAESPDKVWILTDYDTWEKNPHFHGPLCKTAWHPEDDEVDEAFWELHADCRAGGKCLHGYGDPKHGPVYDTFAAGKGPDDGDDIPF